MTRGQMHAKVPEWINEKEDMSNEWHYGKLELHRDMDRILNYMRNEFKEVDNTNRIMLQNLIGKIREEKSVIISPIQNEDYLQGKNEVLNEIATWIEENIEGRKSE